MNEVLLHHDLPKSETVPGEKQAVRALFQGLRASAISYCHWKSNCRLHDTLLGREDIDILVDRRDALSFQAEMARHDFKLAASLDGTEHPSTFHAIGFDRRTAELVDLHACYQVYSGDSLVKNYRLAIEDQLLAKTRELFGVTVPEPELELVYFVIRIALKHLNPVEIVKSNRRYHKTSSELQWLRRQGDDQKAAELCQSLFPAVGQRLFYQLLGAVADDGALLRRMVLGWKIAWRLRGLRRLGAVRALSSRTWRTLAFLRGRLTKRKKQSLQTGGLIVALVGPKATGKSTLADELGKVFGKHLNVFRIHAGKPPASLLSWLPTRFVPVARRLLPHERLSEYETPERRERRDFSLFYVARMALLAYDRRKLLRRALREAAAGAIVISDRYPSETTGAIDSSCFDDIAVANCRSLLKRWLMLAERHFYAGLPHPDLVIRLEAPLVVALERDLTRQKKGGPDAEAIHRRRELESRAKFHQSQLVTLNTSAPLEETVRHAAVAIWGAI